MLVAALAACSDGPLGAWSVLGRHAHRAADWLVMALLAASPLAPGRSAASVIVLEAGALLLWRVSGMTDYDRRGAEAGADGRTAPEPFPSAAVPVPASAPPPAVPPAPPLDPVTELAVRRQARKAGLAVGILRRRAREVRRPSDRP